VGFGTCWSGGECSREDGNLLNKAASRATKKQHGGMTDQDQKRDKAPWMKHFKKSRNQGKPIRVAIFKGYIGELGDPPGGGVKDKENEKKGEWDWDSWGHQL